MLWGLAGLMAVVVGLALVAPFLRRRAAAAQGSAAWDRRVYRDQLAEVERDLARGVIGPEDAARLRTEIGRRLLEADRAAGAEAAPAAVARRGRGVPAILAALLLLVGAGVLYARMGAPTMPDQPIAARIAAAQRAYEARPSQARAEAEAKARPAAPVPQADPAYLRLVEQLRAAVKNRPDDPQGLELLAEHEARLGNIDAALAAQRHLNRLRGGQTTAADHARLAALMTEAAGGLITPEAEAELGRALQLDPSLPEGRYLAGLLEVQNQRPDRAFPIWRGLLEQNPDGPWAAPIRGVIGDLAWFAGQPDYQPPPAAPGSAPGPDAAAVAAAEGMSEEERARMIAGMVEGLEARLASEGGTPEEWARLITALSVQGRADHARDILGEARTVFAGKPEALAPIDAAAGQAGLE